MSMPTKKATEMQFVENYYVVAHNKNNLEYSKIFKKSIEERNLNILHDKKKHCKKAKE